MFIRKVTTTAAILVAGLMVLGGGVALHLYSTASAEPVQAALPPKAPEERAAPVTVGRAVQREVAPFEVFTGNLGSGGVVPTKRVNFMMDERSYLRYQRLLLAGKVKGPRNPLDADADVRDLGDPLAVALSDESSFPHRGHLGGFESTFNSATGCIKVWGLLAEKPNPLLLDGMFVRVRMNFGPPRPVLEVPDEAVGRDQGEMFLWVVNDRNNVARRPVRIGPMDGGMRIIEEGLKADERIVIGGAKGLKPGDHVEP
jgi:hypothetical protein